MAPERDHVWHEAHDLGLVEARVVVCERLGERKVATLDHRHFGVIRPSHAPSLRLLPEPDA